jgi:hypothetical protein
MDGFNANNIREMAAALVVGLLFGLFLSWGAIYGIDRFMSPDDQAAEITGTVRFAPN